MIEITHDSRTVWINDAEGCCIGRFSKHGIDVHHDMAGQIELGVSCLDCKCGPTTIADWLAFKEAMFKHHQVVVGDERMPVFLR